MNDIFSLGSGCMTQDTIPEVTALCTRCAKNEGFPDLALKDIEQFNIKILHKLIQNKFKVSYTDESSSGDESVEYNSFWFNPFSSDGYDSAEDEETEDCSKFKCTICAKQFSQDDFLKFHEEWLHKQARTTVQFVAEPEDLMTTFHGENAENTEEIPVKRSKRNSNKGKTNPKNDAKKYLRFKR